MTSQSLSVTKAAPGHEEPGGPAGNNRRRTLWRDALDSRAPQIDPGRAGTTMAGRRRSCRARPRRPVSRSTRAELQFPVSRVDRLLREGQFAPRISAATPVFLAGVLEYLTSNILELASEEAQSHRRMRITPEHVEKAVDKDQQLSLLFEKDTPLETPSPLGK